MNVVPIFRQEPQQQAPLDIVAQLNRAQVAKAVLRMRREITGVTRGQHGISNEVKLALADLYKAVAADLALGCSANDV